MLCASLGRGGIAALSGVDGLVLTQVAGEAADKCEEEPRSPILLPRSFR